MFKWLFLRRDPLSLDYKLYGFEVELLNDLVRIHSNTRFRLSLFIRFKIVQYLIILKSSWKLLNFLLHWWGIIGRIPFGKIDIDLVLLVECPGPNREVHLVYFSSMA